MPGLDLGLNTGILHVFTRTIAICSIANFLQGVNLGLLFIEHDWSKHPVFLQRIGATSVIAIIIAIACTINYTLLPTFFNLWRDHGMMSPLYCVLIWYSAKDMDILCWLFKSWPMQFVGNISYGMYLFQQVVYDYLANNNPFYTKYGYVQSWYMIPYLMAVAAFGIHCVQKPYTPYLIDAIKKRSQEAKALEPCMKKLHKLLENVWWQLLTVLVFIPTYIAFVNYQGCMPLSCAIPSWSTYSWPPLLSAHRWFQIDDWNWFVNWWTIPCENLGLIQNATVVAGLKTSALIIGYIGLPALTIGVTLAVRNALFPHKLAPVPTWTPTPEHGASSDEEGEGVGRTPLKSMRSLFIRMIVQAYHPSHLAEQSVRIMMKTLQEYSTRINAEHITLEVAGVEPFARFVSPDPSRISLAFFTDAHKETSSERIGMVRERSSAGPGDLIIVMDAKSR